LRLVNANLRATVVMAVAVAAMAWAAPLVRLTTAPPLAIAAWRVAIATVLLLPLAARGPWRREWGATGKLERRLLLVAGAALALHFAAWITSLRLTSVAAASIIVSLSPVFAWVLSARFLGERPGPRQAAGILVAIGGAVLIAATDARGNGRAALLGDLLACFAAAMGGVYFVAGRRLRAGLSLGSYVVPVYGACAAILLLWAGARGELFAAYEARDWAIFAALAAGPMVIGHTGFNYALRWFPAWKVNVAALAEPVGAILIAWSLPAIAEPPGAAALAGGAVALGGIALALSGAPRVAGH
jgi:drug/metabolite transporter (DMT)-like permease